MEGFGGDWGEIPEQPAKANKGKSRTKPERGTENREKPPAKQGNQSKGKSGQKNPVNGGLTVVCFLFTALVSFGVAFFTRNIPVRSELQLALTFALPVTALFVSGFLFDKVTGSMTPSSSRGLQAGLVALVIVLSGVLGFFCRGFDSVSNERMTNVWNDCVIIIDKSGSMRREGKDKASIDAVSAMLDDMPEELRVGLVKFDTYVYDEKSPAPLTAAYKQELKHAVTVNQGYGRTNYARALNTAFDLADRAGAGSTKLHFILLADSSAADADPEFEGQKDAFLRKATDRGIVLDYIHIGASAADASPALLELVSGTGGQLIEVTDPGTLLEQMRVAVQSKVTYSFDALRNISSSPKASMLMAVLIAILGLLIGFALTLMFGASGQWIWQPLISVFCALAAFAVLYFGNTLISDFNVVLKGAQLYPDVPELANTEFVSNHLSWIVEGIAFSLLGIVFMRKNRLSEEERKKLKPQGEAPEQPVNPWGFDAGSGSGSGNFDSFDSFGSAPAAGSKRGKGPKGGAPSAPEDPFGF